MVPLSYVHVKTMQCWMVSINGHNTHAHTHTYAHAQTHAHLHGSRTLHISCSSVSYESYRSSSVIIGWPETQSAIGE